MQCFHQGATNRGTSWRVLFFNLLMCQNWEDLFLKVMKIKLISHERSELMKQECQVGSLNSCVNELQQQAYAQGLELQDAHHGYVESRREQARLSEELSMKEQLLSEILRYGICTKWEKLRELMNKE